MRKKKKRTPRTTTRKPPSLAVYVFWDSNHDPKQNADSYCECVRNASSVQNPCQATCTKIEVVGQSSHPAMQYWAGDGTIEVAFVKNAVKVATLMNPDLFCEDIQRQIAELCR